MNRPPRLKVLNTLNFPGKGSRKVFFPTNGDGYDEELPAITPPWGTPGATQNAAPEEISIRIPTFLASLLTIVKAPSFHLPPKFLVLPNSMFRNGCSLDILQDFLYQPASMDIALSAHDGLQEVRVRVRSTRKLRQMKRTLLLFKPLWPCSFYPHYRFGDVETVIPDLLKVGEHIDEDKTGVNSTDSFVEPLYMSPSQGVL